MREGGSEQREAEGEGEEKGGNLRRKVAALEEESRMDNLDPEAARAFAAGFLKLNLQAFNLRVSNPSARKPPGRLDLSK